MAQHAAERLFQVALGESGSVGPAASTVRLMRSPDRKTPARCRGYGCGDQIRCPSSRSARSSSIMAFSVLHPRR